MALVSQHEELAKLGCESKLAASQGYFHAVMAAECALKAYIWHVERFNQAPTKEQRPELFGHNLRALKDKGGILVSRADPKAASWAVLLQSDRNQYYDPKPMPRKVARAMVEASFGEFGVVTWIRRQLNP
jgi:hypothetical protein